MKAKRFFGILLCAALVLTLLPTAARAEGGGYAYIDASGDTKNTGSKPVTEIAEDSDLSSGTLGTSGTATWYIVTGDGIEHAGTVTVSGDVHLILADDASLAVTGSGDNAGINVSGTTNSLTIYGQSTGNAMGALTATGGSYTHSGGTGGAGGTVTINGGDVTATGGGTGAGIGGGYYGAGGTVTISGGDVAATGGSNGAGIGGGVGGIGGTVTITGGDVTATGGNYGAGIGGGSMRGNDTVTISGGVVLAQGGEHGGAGIGGGYSGAGGEVSISGGEVTSTGGNYGGAGIGGGSGGKGGTVTITGGTVTATGSQYGGTGGAGIGGGNGGAGGTVTISDGTVTAAGGEYGGAGGIGGGSGGAGGTVTISGGTVMATGSEYNGAGGAGIGGGKGGSGGEIAVSGGVVFAQGAAGVSDIGPGQDGTDGGTLGISGTAAVFLKNKTSTTPTNLTTHAYYEITGHTAGGTVRGISVSWSGAFGAYLPGYDYLDENGETQNTGITPVTELSGSTIGETLNSGWYIVLDANVTRTSTVTVRGDVHLILADGASLAVTGSEFGAGIDVSGAANSLTIYAQAAGTGSLTANGGSYSAGIGGGEDCSGGTVNINGGHVTANGGNNGAGIGGGYGATGGGNGGTVTISGGVVTATGGDDGAGIGGGTSGYNSGGAGGSVAITGGSVNAAIQATPTNRTDNGSATVYLTTVTLEGVSAETAVSALTTGLNYTYGTTDMKTDGNGKLYLYLPDGTETTDAWTETLRYTGSVETATGSASAGTLSRDTTVPTVASVTPSGTNAAASGNLVITFSEEMRSGSGSVSLSGSATSLTGGSWNAAKTVYTVPYSGLASVTAYTVTVSGFEDYSGNAMAEDTGHSFTTAPSADASLSSLSISAGTLSPGFAPERTDYSVSVGNSINTLTVTPTANHTAAAVTVNGDSVTSGTASAPISLSVGENAVTIIVTAQDDTTTQTYTVTVTRASAPGPGPDDDDPPTVITNTVTGITVSGATLSGSVTASGGAAVTERGFVYGNAVNPEIGGAGVTKVTVGSGTGGFSAALTGLSANTAYHVRAYAVNQAGTGYGADVTFTTPVSNPFSDVSDTDWFYHDALYACANGLMTGTASDTFSPDGKMTRAMAVTVLYRMSGETGGFSGGFSDVPEGAWYAQAVGWAAENGLVSGVGGGRFDPDAPVTREQLAALLYRFAQYMGYDVSVGEETNILSYPDAFNISEYAYPALQWACGAGVLKGDDAGNLNPGAPVTRAEAAAMLARFAENVAVQKQA